MSGTVRFDDEHVVKFVLDAENLVVHLTVILEDETYYTDAPLENVD